MGFVLKRSLSEIKYGQEMIPFVADLGHDNVSYYKPRLSAL